ncbi:Uma2 family endonuclease [Kitasatospora sp. NPDC059747]|uniref:Uma2 family endonuclease n=1 Tax=Kitasatospora sp. NPDC059747 TaxID=3346930 RepID=UPI00364DE4EE
MPDDPYVMWCRGELAEHFRLPYDLRIEVLDGVLAVLPALDDSGVGILLDVERAVESACSWRVLRQVKVDLAEIENGYIPDLAVVGREAGECRQMRETVRSGDLELAVEVTSSFNAENSRRPSLGGSKRATKWSGYARTGVPYYLLVDRDPRQPGVTLFGAPDKAEGAYEVLGEWKFGESVRLPEPFGVEIGTDAWRPWSA